MKTKLLNGHPFTTYTRETYPPAQMKSRSETFLKWMEARRTVRDISDAPVPKSVIENIILTASTAPSGAHKQPWTFCVVEDKTLKAHIRTAAEKEEKESYEGRMTEEWLQDLAPIGTDWQKPFLETAPYLIIVFKKSYDLAGGTRRKNYYITESCGIACGFLLAAIHHAGLVALTHTPSPMNFLTKILNRPENEKPFLLLPVGLPAEEVWVPDLKRKGLEAVSVWF